MFNAAEQKTFSINLLKQPTLTHSQNTHIHTKYTFMYHLCISFMFVCACILFDIQFLYKYLYIIYVYLSVLFNMRCFTNIYLDWHPHLDHPNCQVLAVIWPAPAAAARQMPRVRSPFCPLFWSFPKHIRSTFCVTSSPNWMWMCRTLSWRPSIHSTCVPGK